MNNVKWTEEQLSAITEKGTNILVAAAAGSGKTAVLVERIIHKIIYEKIDIDSILVVTFTNAAASEMRERILNAIYKYLDEHPEDEHMKKQTMLIYKANICTIHSFCLDAIRNNFYEINISPNFRIGDQTEVELLKEEILEELFEQKYEENDVEFLKLINTYTSYRGDDQLRDLVLKIYKFIQATPFPEEWLNENAEKFNLKNELEQDFSKTEWGKILLDLLKEEIEDCILELGRLKEKLSKHTELEKYYVTIINDIEGLQNTLNCDTWDDIYEIANQTKFENWPRDSKVISETKEIAKQKREEIKKRFYKIRDKILLYNSRQINEDIYNMYPVITSICKLVIEFSSKFAEAKKEKNMIDFNDIEHFALNILLKKAENELIPTEVAKKYKEKFIEIAIDEYQDSNLVQEYILTTISKGNNIFMVGDVKQSIYKFRQARPELFLQKYESYKLKNEIKENENLKIQLFKNFRSRKNILDVTNLIFESIMSKKLGDILYDKNEYLNLGANYEEPAEKIEYAGKTELNIIDLKQSEDNENDEEDKIDNMVVEAKLVAKRIKDLINSKYQVYDKKVGYRDIKYRDIVILLRATSVLAPIYEKELNLLNIPVFSDVGAQYTDSVEIQTILSVLKIIDNPMQDIPLVTVLRSQIGKFNDNELIAIKLDGDTEKKNTYFYESILNAKETTKDEQLKHKIEIFLEQIENWRKQNEYLSIAELIWKIYLDTGYYNYVGLMQNGSIRQANLKLLFEKAKDYENGSFKGLFNFINFMDRLNVSRGDTDSAKLIGENEDVTRIMSIHKSKGLEFPVVFLCGTGKKINLQDINESVLLHQDIGFGLKYIDYERRIEYNTLAKEAIANKIKLETISEEMRILYVALTRAKEKLIITGIKKDLSKDISKKQESLEILNQENIPTSIIKSNPSYLDWIEMVYLMKKQKMEELIELKIHEISEFSKELDDTQTEDKEMTFRKLSEFKKEKIEEVKDKLEWEYEYKEASTIPAISSVTQIKQLSNEENIINENLTVPNFLKEEKKLTGAQKGTLMHLCIQKLNEKEEYTKEKIEDLISNLVKNEIITQNEADSIDVQKLINYTQSDLFISLKNAKEVYKEQPFYIYMKSKEIYNNKLEDKVLVQGIIDLYYIDKHDNIILVDYKTDYVENKENELVQKYRKQLETYKIALEKSISKKVEEVYIYSIYLNKLIKYN